jgi:hypothetical protein
MAAIVNACDVALQATSPRMKSVNAGSNVTLDFGNVTGSTKPDDNADVTSAEVNSGITINVLGGGFTFSANGSIKGGQTDYATGTGWFLGYSGGAYKFSIGSTTRYLRWDGSTFTYRGDISGDGDISTTGSATFGGSTLQGGKTYAGVFNPSGASSGGVYGHTQAAGGTGVLGEATAGNSGTAGVRGTANSGQVAVSAENVGGTALAVLGNQTINNSNMVNNLNAELWHGVSTPGSTSSGAAVATFDNTKKPGSASTNAWMRITMGGNDYYIPVWPA